MVRSCDKSRPWNKMAVLAQDPKSDPASILSPALVSNGCLGKGKKKNHLQRFLLWGASWSKKRYADRQGFRKGAKGVIRFTMNIFTRVMSCGASGHWAGTHLCTLTAANTTFPSSKYTKVKNPINQFDIGDNNTETEREMKTETWWCQNQKSTPACQANASGSYNYTNEMGCGVGTGIFPTSSIPFSC